MPIEETCAATDRKNEKSLTRHIKLEDPAATRKPLICAYKIDNNSAENPSFVCYKQKY